MIGFVRFNFLDAPALVKLLLYPDIKEKGSNKLFDYYRDQSNFGTINLCIAEALSVIKSMHFGNANRRKLGMDGYLIIVNRLRAILKNRKIEPYNFDFIREEHFAEASRMVTEYKIDFIDALQIVAVKLGPFCSFAGKSQTLLITADKKLSSAGKKEGIKTWYVIDEAPVD